MLPKSFPVITGLEFSNVQSEIEAPFKVKDELFFQLLPVTVLPVEISVVPQSKNVQPFSVTVDLLVAEFVSKNPRSVASRPMNRQPVKVAVVSEP